MNVEDTYEGLEDVWYRFSTDVNGNIDLWATPDGFEHLARYFLKLARGNKSPGYHAHDALELRTDRDFAGAELTIGILAAGSRSDTGA